MNRPGIEELAISVDLGSIQSTAEPIVWVVGVVRDPVVQYTNAEGNFTKSEYVATKTTYIRNAWRIVCQ